MITPVWALTIFKLCERKDDLVLSDKDIKELAKKEREKAISEFAEAICKRAEEESTDVFFPDGLHGLVVEIDDLKRMVGEIAERMKGGVKNG